MALRFLCETHCQQLAGPGQGAEQRWEEWMAAGRRAFSAREWPQALRYLGCCFELSEILLDKTACPSLEALDRYMVAGHFLAECFANAGSSDLQQHCLLAVHHRLLTMIRCPQGQRLPLQRNVEFSLEMLSRFYRQRGKLDAFEHCARESKRLLRRCYH